MAGPSFKILSPLNEKEIVIQTRLCIQLLGEYFGEIVSKIGNSLIILGPSSLSLVASHAKETFSNCRKALATLIQHQIVSYSKHEKGFILYSIDLDRILLILRYPKYIHVAKFFYGVVGEQIIEKILKDGMVNIDDLVKILSQDLKETLAHVDCDSVPNMIYQTFVKMVQAKYISPCCVYSESEKSPRWYYDLLNTNDEEEIQVPPLKNQTEVEEPKAKRRRKEQPEKSEEFFYWMINIAPFHNALRNMMLIEGLRTHFSDDKAASLVNAILHCSASDPSSCSRETSLVPKTDIVKYCLQEKIFSNIEEIDTYLLYLVDDINNFVVMPEERAGIAMYQVNSFKVIDKLVKTCVVSAVIDRFGPRSGRIFSLLLSRRLLQQKQIEELAMVDPKDAKECTYNLFKNRFIKIMQFPTQNDYTPSKACFLFSTDVEDVCRLTIQRCYQAIFNCIVRKNHESQTHKSLIDRKVFVDTVITNLRLQSGQQSDIEQQIEELNQSFSSHDRELLEKLRKLSFTLEVSELKIDETLFLMQSWITMNRL